ncbi:MAG: threonine aldolase family protein [Actinomycetota bacterium]
MIVDLRSDTVTQPTTAMRNAIATARVGDDVYGDDPTVNLLEEKVAKLFGKEAAVFTPSGSLANQLCIRTLVKPGEELICEVNSHIVRAELGAAAAFSGITTRTWTDPYGELSANRAIEIARPNSGPYLVSTTAVAVENTHNFGGGTIQDIKEIEALKKWAEPNGVKLHLDGARIWNSHIASGVPLSEYGKHFETLSVCLSKGLGAPIGSLMISTKERVAEARVWRKRYGGGMRQVGIIAAAGLFAIENNISRLVEDHLRAKQLAEACHEVIPNVIDPTRVSTNIVGLELLGANISAGDFVARARAEGVWMGALGPTYARLVTHLDIDDSGIEFAVKVLQKLLKQAFVSK